MDERVEKGISIAKIGVSAIPYIGGVISEIIGYVNNEILKKRLNLIEDEIKYQKSSFEEFKKNIENLNEHKFFFCKK